VDLELKGKVALVTGGSRGLGRAICLGLASEGVNVAVNYYKSDKAEEAKAADLTAEIQNKYKTKAIPLPGDVTLKEDIEEMFETIKDTFGQVDILVNNAGIWPTSYVSDMKKEEWDNTIDVNLTGPFLLCQKMVCHLIKIKRPGKIINIVSQAAFRGSTSGHAHYAAAKAGLVAFTVSLAREVASYGINVNAVAPGMMKTDMAQKALKKRNDAYIERIPLGRIAEPAEVANVVVFLASEKSGYMTGATLDVTGGMLMR